VSDSNSPSSGDIGRAAQPADLPEEENRDGVNIAAVLFVIALALGGIWLFNKLIEHSQIENCIASGRHDCVKLDPSAVPNP
jgi:hypothetical protein